MPVITYISNDKILSRLHISCEPDYESASAEALKNMARTFVLSMYPNPRPGDSVFLCIDLDVWESKAHAGGWGSIGGWGDWKKVNMEGVQIG
jgi:hypothetical protein